MIDRDKVIKGLEEVVNDFHEEVDEWSAYTNDELRGGTTVDCDWFYGVMEKCEAALALLEAHEPRLLSAEEVVGCIVLKRDKTLWFEFRDGGIMEISAKKMGYNDFVCDEDCPILDDPNIVWKDGDKRDSVIIAEYNDVFRCWDECPTDAQREATPWN